MPGTAAFTVLHDLEIGRAGVGRVNAALHAHFRRAPPPCLARLLGDHVERQIIGRAAQMFGRLALGERAELAAQSADIGVIDIARYDIGRAIAVNALAQLVAAAQTAEKSDPRAWNRLTISASVRIPPSAALPVMRMDVATRGREASGRAIRSAAGNGSDGAWHPIVGARPALRRRSRAEAACAGWDRPSAPRSGYSADRSAGEPPGACPRPPSRRRKASKCGQGASGFT